jgi:hypothetical protein
MAEAIPLERRLGDEPWVRCRIQRRTIEGNLINMFSGSMPKTGDF